MSILFENLMFCIFIVADFIWLVQIWKTTKTFSISEKLRSVTFTTAFLLGFVWMALENPILGAIFCMIGFMVSQFTVAVTFYENYKELEIPHE